MTSNPKCACSMGAAEYRHHALTCPVFIAGKTAAEQRPSKERLRMTGICRDAQCDTSLALFFNRVPTDDEMRDVQESLRPTPEPLPAPKEQIYREALERIYSFHDRVDIVEAWTVAENALKDSAEICPEHVIKWIAGCPSCIRAQDVRRPRTSSLSAPSHEPRANTEGEVGLAADVGPGGGASASASGATHAPELSPALPPPVVQDMEKIAWCQKVHEDLAVYVDDGGGQMIHVRAKRALGIMFEEMQKLEKALYPSLTKSASVILSVKPACQECRGGGQICTGNSGREDDGYAPILERCEACDGTGVANETSGEQS